MAVSTNVAIDVVALIAAGSAWITGLGLLGAAYQSEMPLWVKARGMSYYLIAFQGSNAIGALAFGAVAQAVDLDRARRRHRLPGRRDRGHVEARAPGCAGGGGAAR